MFGFGGGVGGGIARTWTPSKGRRDHDTNPSLGWTGDNYLTGTRAPATHTVHPLWRSSDQEWDTMDFPRGESYLRDLWEHLPNCSRRDIVRGSAKDVFYGVTDNWGDSGQLGLGWHNATCTTLLGVRISVTLSTWGDDWPPTTFDNMGPSMQPDPQMVPTLAADRQSDIAMDYNLDPLAFYTDVPFPDPDVRGHRHDGRNWTTQLGMVLFAGAFPFKNWLTQQAERFVELILHTLDHEDPNTIVHLRIGVHCHKGKHRSPSAARILAHALWQLGCKVAFINDIDLHHAYVPGMRATSGREGRMNACDCDVCQLDGNTGP